MGDPGDFEKNRRIYQVRGIPAIVAGPKAFCDIEDCEPT
jgi:hypothetical protein